ncbi:hypothetical protein, conserved [Eimeria maxima]|uniref:Haloacid dehalogenase-like hydrolase domain-containing protein n=1 Tax=Eimeria maxima TaxID=5804 RepID=U6MDB6_EIMMA|nr:hypothetical protein, conserved [Eimeria maxima]CDJ59655.1 hypothetical protein, conserved [Eimeria maxima]
MDFSGFPGIYLNDAYVLGPAGEVLRDSPLAHDTLKHILQIIKEAGLLDKASRPTAFEVLQPGIDKGEVLRLLSAVLGISPEEVLAVGNAHNDLPMFKVAGTAVAVKDGYDDAKEAVDFITVPNTEGALVQVLLYVKAHLYLHSPSHEGTATVLSSVEAARATSAMDADDHLIIHLFRFPYGGAKNGWFYFRSGVQAIRGTSHMGIDDHLIV